MRLAIASMVLLAASVAPRPQIVLPCKVYHVHDGDTPYVEVTLKVKVRLKDINAPELDEEGGVESREYLKKVALGKKGILQIPLDKSTSIGSPFSFERVVGYVWIDGKNLNDLLLESGHAEKVK